MKDLTKNSLATTDTQIAAWLADAEERGIQVAYITEGLGCVLANVKAIGQNGFRRSGSKVHTVFANVVIGSLSEDADRRTYAGSFLHRTSDLGKLRHGGREYDPWSTSDAIVASAYSPCNGNGQHVSRVVQMKYDADAITCRSCSK